MIVTADIPNFNKNEISVTVEDGTLEIVGESANSIEEQGNSQWYEVDQNYSLRRRITLPEVVSENDVTATYLNGVLTIKLNVETPVETDDNSNGNVQVN